MDDDTLFGVVIGLMVVHAMLMLGFALNANPAPPKGYTDVGNHVSYKCDHGSILWYDSANGRQLNTTLDDGRCHE